MNWTALSFSGCANLFWVAIVSFFKNVFLHQFSAGWNFSCLLSVSVLLCFFRAMHLYLSFYTWWHLSVCLPPFKWGHQERNFEASSQGGYGNLCLDASFFLMCFSSATDVVNRTMHTLFSKKLPEPTFPKTFKGGSLNLV